ncbi:MAG: flagellar biosynthetic protein FliR [Desulfobacula sp.]|jgi:flagellar biosynthesis protein FliR|nr:flagellar biosynthetic protein FliR [Desulfobacula sp.]
MQQITAEQIETFIFVLLRVTAIVSTMPILGNRRIPVRVKGGLSLLITYLLYPFIEFQTPPSDILMLALRMAGEIMVGITLGLAGRLIFAGVQLAGQIAGFQMGFAIVNVFDPITSTQVSIIAQFYYLLAMLIFLAVDGHHLFIYSIAESYRIVPPFDFHFSGELTQSIVELSKSIFIVAIKAGALVMTVLLMISIGFGMIARTVPQINILIVGFPIKIAVGLIGIGLALPSFVRMMAATFVNFGETLNLLLRIM